MGSGRPWGVPTARARPALASTSGKATALSGRPGGTRAGKAPAERGAWPMPPTQVALHFLSQLKTTTTAAISRDFTEDRIWLNGREEDVGQPRLQACLRESEWGPRGCWGQARPAPSPVPRPRAGQVRVHRRRCRRHLPPHRPVPPTPQGPRTPVSTAGSGPGAWGLPRRSACGARTEAGPLRADPRRCLLSPQSVAWPASGGATATRSRCPSASATRCTWPR